MNKSSFFKLSTIHNFVIVAFLFFGFASCNNDSQQKQTSKTDLLAAAKELDSLFLAAFNNGDAEAIMKLHWNSPELRAYPPGEMQVNGYEEVKTGYIKEFASSKGARLEYTSSNNIQFGDAVMGYGTFKWSLPIQAGKPIEFEGRYTEVKAMREGKLVIIVDHTSMPLPPVPVDSLQAK